MVISYCYGFLRASWKGANSFELCAVALLKIESWDTKQMQRDNLKILSLHHV